MNGSQRYLRSKIYKSDQRGTIEQDAKNDRFVGVRGGCKKLAEKEYQKRIMFLFCFKNYFGRCRRVDKVKCSALHMLILKSLKNI